jgi:hypothetical protein
MKHFRIAAVASLCACVLVVGCGKKKPAPAKTADKAVMTVTKALQDNQPQVVFQSMPASYQAEIKSVVTDAASRMDEEVWNESRDLLKSVVKIAKAKKELLLQTSMLAANPKKEELSKNWDQGMDMLSTILSSDFADLKKLRKGDIEALLAGSGSEIMKKASKLKSNAEMQENLEKLKSVKAALESQEGNVAKVKITADGEEPETVDFVKVEGKWLPKDMADNFAAKVKEARENLSEIDFSSEEGKALKAKILTQISAAKTMLSKAEAAKTKEEMDGVLMGMMMSVMMSGGAGGAGTPPPPPSM